MVEDIKLILVFISNNLMNFLITSLKKTILFFITLLIIIPFFFISLKHRIQFSYIIDICILILCALYILKEFFFKNSNFIFNYKFLKFIKNIQQDDNKGKNIVFSNKDYKIVKRKIIKEENILPLRRLVLAFYVASIIEKKNSFNKNNKKIKIQLLKIYSAGYGSFILLTIFFGFISLALALGNGIAHDFTIFLLLIGFVFSYALFSIIIEPILLLMIQKTIIS